MKNKKHDIILNHMTRTITINKHWFDTRLTPALDSIKRSDVRAKIQSIILGLIQLQRESDSYGLKECFADKVIPVSSHTIRLWFKNVNSQTFFRSFVSKFNLIRKDRSWINKDLADKLNVATHCDSWHITECDDISKKTIDVAFGDYFVKKSIEYIESAEGKMVDDAHHFTGKWVIEEFNDSKVNLTTLFEVAKVAHILTKPIKNSISNRVFDAVALCKKDLRGRCFVDSENNGMKEVYDIPAAITITAPLAFAALKKTPEFNDIDINQWAILLANNLQADPYKVIYNRMYTQAQQKDHPFTKQRRKVLKMDVQCIANSNEEYFQKCKAAYESKKYKSAQYRQYCVWLAIEKCNKPLAKAIKSCRSSGLKDAFYRLHTFGEKILMDTLIGLLKDNGITLHRVHDSVWTSNPTLTNLSEEDANKYVGKKFRMAFGCLDSFGRKTFIRKKLQEKKITQDEYMAKIRELHDHVGIISVAKVFAKPSKDQIKWTLEGITEKKVSEMSKIA